VYSPFNKSAKEQSNGFLDVFCTQPAPLVLHQQTQDIQSNICQGSVCIITNIKIWQCKGRVRF